MSDLAEAMRQATDALPPTGIDLDSIIHDHYRRARRLRGLAAAGGALAVTAAVVAGMLLVSGPARGPVAAVGLPLSAPGSRPWDDGPTGPFLSTQTSYLEFVFEMDLNLALPAGAVASLPSFSWNRENGEYHTSFVVVDRNNQRTTLDAVVRFESLPADLQCGLDDPPRVYCSATAEPDGSQLWVLHADSEATQGRATRASEHVWPNGPGQPATSASLMEQADGPGLDRLIFDQPALDRLAGMLHMRP